MLAHTTWQMALSEYDIVYTRQKAIKRSTLAKQLDHHPLDDYQTLLHEFPDEHIMMFDGASNLFENWIGEVLASLEGQCFPFLARLGFDYTNNIVEYESYAMGIKLKVFSNSTLVTYRLRGEWKTRDTKLIPYHNHVTEMSEHFNKITFHYVPRDENQIANALATLSFMLLVNKEEEMAIQV
ncbi:hypothetical protein CR513_33944, partial [Mucuna pruriens]